MFMLQSAQEPKGVSKLLLLKAYILLIFQNVIHNWRVFLMETKG